MSDSKGAEAQRSKKNGSHAHHLRPRVDKKTISKLSSRQLDELLKEIDTVDLDPFKPESSLWLRNIMKLIKCKDFDKRFFALHKFSEILLVVKKLTPELCASFAAYVIEQGILVKVVRILRAAQSHGDFYLIPEAEGSFEEFLRKGVVVQSKVEVCFKILHGLMAEPRTVRFIRKAIPDLIDILEGAYLSLDPFYEVLGRRELVLGPPLAIRDDEKEAAIMVLGPLSLWSDQARETVLSRMVLLREILKDCMAGTDFSGHIINRVITLFSSFVFSPDKFLSLSGEFMEVGFKALEVSERKAILGLAVEVLDWIFTRQVNSKALQMTIKTRSAEFLSPVLSLVACPTSEQHLGRSVYNLLRVLDDKIYTTVLSSANPEETVNKLLQAQYPKGLIRKQQLCEILPKRPHLQAGSDPLKNTTLFTHEHDSDQKRECFTLATKEDLARLKPCRKCSRSGCAKTETDPGQYKLCSECRLAVYCSRDCQKLAWRGGHKSSCEGGGRETQNKSKTDRF